MMNMKFIIFHLYVVLEVAYGQKLIDDACTVQSSEAPGVCKFVTDCQMVIESLRKYNQTPQICSFKGIQPIVCCPRNFSNSGREPGEISKRKCREYVSYAYEDRGLIDNTTRILKNSCKNDRVNEFIPENDRVKRKEFPHMAVIGYEMNPGDVKWLCGGTIISENYILTAAHCLSHILYGPPKYVRIGVTDLNDTNHRQELKIAELIAYPEFKVPSRYHDIGLVKLEKSAEMNPYARPACLYTKFNITVNNAVVTGWDTMNWGDSLYSNNNLLKLRLDFVDHKSCNSNYKNQLSIKPRNEIVNDIQICAGLEPQKGVCEPQSGGPLQIYPEDDQTDCMYDIVGIKSFGNFCTTNRPSIYTRVSHYIKWIEDIVWPDVL